MADAGALTAALSDGVVRLAPLGEEHREGVRAACAADPAIWDVYFTSWLDPHFDASFDGL